MSEDGAAAHQDWGEGAPDDLAAALKKNCPSQKPGGHALNDRAAAHLNWEEDAPKDGAAAGWKAPQMTGLQPKKRGEDMPKDGAPAQHDREGGGRAKQHGHCPPRL